MSNNSLAKKIFLTFESFLPETNKSHLANEASISKSAAEKALSAFTDGVKSVMRKGEDVTLIGFGNKILLS